MFVVTAEWRWIQSDCGWWTEVWFTYFWSQRTTYWYAFTALFPPFLWLLSIFWCDCMVWI